MRSVFQNHLAAYPGPPSVAIAGTISQVDASSGFTYDVGVITLTIIKGTATSYNWSLSNPTNGTWAIDSDPTDASPVVSVNGVDLGFTYMAHVDLTCTAIVNGISCTDTVNLSFRNSTTPPGLSVSSSQSLSGTTTSKTFSAVTATSDDGTTPTAYSWAYSNQNNGTFAGSSTTASFTPSVSGVGSSTTASATLTCTATIGGVQYSDSVSLSYRNTTAIVTPSVSISPNGQTLTGATTSKTFSAEAATVSNGTASAYSWSYTSSSGGTWGFSGGTTSSSCTPTVSGVSAGVTATSSLRCTATVSGTNYTANVALSFKNTTTPSVSVTPASQAPTGASSSKTFSTETATVSNGTATAYSWTQSSKVGGTWGFSGGTTSSTCVPTVSGVAAGVTATCTLKCTATVAGTNYSDTASLSYKNTTSSVTFSPVSGSYSADDGGTASSVSFNITTSPSTTVTWTWSSSGSTVMSGVTSGGSATGISFTLLNGVADKSSTIICSASGAASGSWTIDLFSTGNGGVIQNTCVTTDAVLPTHERADLVKVGDQIAIANPLTFSLRMGKVTRADIGPDDCVRITTSSGIELECSYSAPIAVQDGSLVDAIALQGQWVAVVDNGDCRYEEVVSVERIGFRDVVHITCENDLFLAGKQKNRYLLHHNVKQ
jgi:hypothetical protein